ncbi:MAG: HAD family phosphatase [Spirulina sp. SIO3F2]|nr:HAD family phosphatase [Spirulina sp. SIO3F2]
MMLKAVFLEFHGTVLNDARLREQITSDLLLQNNLRPNAQDYQQCCVGRRDRACLHDLLEQRGRLVNTPMLQNLVNTKQQAYGKAIASCNELPIYPGLEVFIRKLQSANLKIGLLTLLSAQIIEPILARANLLNAFDAWLTADEDWLSPPEPEGYEHLLQKVCQLEPGLTAANCLAIDHTLPGIAAAHLAGMAVVGITHTYPLHILQRHASWVVDKFNELELERIEAVFAGSDRRAAASAS